MALICQATHCLEWYATSIVVDTDQAAWKCVRMLPTPVGGRIQRRLRRRQAPLRRDLVRCNVWPELLDLAARRILRVDQARFALWSTHLRNVVFDRWVAGRLPDSATAVYACEGSALATFRRAATVGARTFLEGTVHPKHYEVTLRPEYEYLGLPYPRHAPTPQRVLEEIAVADRVLTQSEFGMSTYAKYGLPRDKVICVPLGVDGSVFNAQAFSPAESQRSELRILYVGTLSVRKGVARLLEALKLLGEGDLKLTLIGRMDGEFRSVWERLKGAAAWIPGLSRDELVTYYRDADLLVLPSLCDSFGQTALEAMACGTPVVVTSACGVQVKHGVEGYVVQPGSSEALANVLGRASTKRDELRMLGENAAARAEALTWTRFEAQMVEALCSQ